MLRIPIALALIIFNSFGSLYAMQEMWIACRNDDIKQVKLIIEQDSTLVNANAQCCHNWTPLYIASLWGRTKTAALLLQHKAKVNAQDCYNWTPLHCISYEGHLKTMKLLLSYGATPHKPINLFATYEKYSQTYAQRYESWICKTFVSRKTIALLLSLIGRKKTTDIPLLPKDMRNLIADYAISDQEREREKSSQNSNHQDPVQEWEQFKKDNPDIAALARIELP